MGGNDSEALFPPISGDDTGITEIDSMCPSCHDEGTTRLLLTHIPFFREVIVSSFSCPHCFCSNNEVQPASTIQEKGCKYSLKVAKKQDLDRQVVTSDTATVQIPEIDFEIPPKTRKGTLSTIEGILKRTIEGLQQEQPVRRALYPKDAQKIDVFIETVEKLCKNPSFTLIIDDPSGNSFIENPSAPNNDQLLTTELYRRTLDQQKMLGLLDDDATEGEINLPETTDTLNLNEEVVSFQTNCPLCNVINETKMKIVKVPYFKEVIIMATNCDNCGNRTNEVKTAGGFEPMGKRTTLKATKKEDLSRDVLTSTTCILHIPELDLETHAISTSGKFTTVEGLLLGVKDVIVDSNPFSKGDSAKSTKLLDIGNRLLEFAQGKADFTLILDDPGNNSFIQNLNFPDDDPFLKVEEYERTYEQNEELGLNDMKV